MSDGIMLNPDAYPKHGYQTFDSWWLPPGYRPRGITPTDMDAVIHNALNDTVCALEFKPSIERLTYGQFLALRWYARQRGSFALLVVDPFTAYVNLGRLADAAPWHFAQILPGMNSTSELAVQLTTVGAFRWWFWNFVTQSEAS
jgi:hypothetical protein